MTPTSLRPDIVWWSDEEMEVKMFELTISHESVMEQARQIKQVNYQDLIDEVMRVGYTAQLISMEVASRSLVAESELIELKEAQSASKFDILQLDMSL